MLAAERGAAANTLAAYRRDFDTNFYQVREEMVAVPANMYAYGDAFWRYSIKNAEGKTIAMPLPQLHWETKEECLKAIEELKMILNKGKTTDFKEPKDSK